MNLRYAYYPGCSAQSSAQEYERSLQGCARALGIDLQEIADWSCCGSSPAHFKSHDLASALAGRNILLAESLGVQELLTPCPSCLFNLRSAWMRLQEPGYQEKICSILEMQGEFKVWPKSFLQAVVEDVGLEQIEGHQVQPLKGLRVVCYYGCILNRPPKLMRFDDPEQPQAMDRLLKALGAEVIPYPLKVECCGASYGPTKKKVVVRLSGKLLSLARELGAEAMVTACPLCQMNLDLRQSQVNKGWGEQFNLPVFYFTQLLGLALGLKKRELAFHKLCVSPWPLFAKYELGVS